MTMYSALVQLFVEGGIILFFSAMEQSQML